MEGERKGKRKGREGKGKGRGGKEQERGGGREEGEKEREGGEGKETCSKIWYTPLEILKSLFELLISKPA